MDEIFNAVIKQFYESRMVAVYLLLPVVIIFILWLLYIAVRLNGSEYTNISGNGLLKTAFSTGNYGEFLTFSLLERLGESKILTNLYLPREDGFTTEADLLVVNSTGLYVFESKNYGGWIYGDEKNKYWTQTFKSGKKSCFFNPVWQNKGHIAAVDPLFGKEVFELFLFLCHFQQALRIEENNHLLSRSIRNQKRRTSAGNETAEVNPRRSVVGETGGGYLSKA